MREGIALSEGNVLARYYNNIAADHFAKKNLPLAYAWFKAAILADESYSASYSNMAQLYRRAGLMESAELLLVHALALNSEDGTAPNALRQLLAMQGRDAEAAKYANIVQTRRERSPYHWLGIGMDYLRAAQYGSAVRALKQAESLSAGFEEVHRNLAIAYLGKGDSANANKQLEALTSLSTTTRADMDLAALRRKIGKMPAN
jgi:Tfp pilus assembly protein PilF